MGRRSRLRVGESSSGRKRKEGRRRRWRGSCCEEGEGMRGGWLGEAREGEVRMVERWCEERSFFQSFRCPVTPEGEKAHYRFFFCCPCHARAVKKPTKWQPQLKESEGQMTDLPRHTHHWPRESSAPNVCTPKRDRFTRASRPGGPFSALSRFFVLFLSFLPSLSLVPTSPSPNTPVCDTPILAPWSTSTPSPQTRTRCSSARSPRSHRSASMQEPPSASTLSSCPPSASSPPQAPSPSGTRPSTPRGVSAQMLLSSVVKADKSRQPWSNARFSMARL